VPRTHLQESKFWLTTPSA